MFAHPPSPDARPHRDPPSTPRPRPTSPQRRWARRQSVSDEAADRMQTRRAYCQHDFWSFVDETPHTYLPAVRRTLPPPLMRYFAPGCLPPPSMHCEAADVAARGFVLRTHVAEQAFANEAWHVDIDGPQGHRQMAQLAWFHVGFAVLFRPPPRGTRYPCTHGELIDAIELAKEIIEQHGLPSLWVDDDGESDSSPEPQACPRSVRAPRRQRSHSDGVGLPTTPAPGRGAEWFFLPRRQTQ